MTVDERVLIGSNDFVTRAPDGDAEDAKRVSRKLDGGHVGFPSTWSVRTDCSVPLVRDLKMERELSVCHCLTLRFGHRHQKA
jgi:hypothetical protein